MCTTPVSFVCWRSLAGIYSTHVRRSWHLGRLLAVLCMLDTPLLIPKLPEMLLNGYNCHEGSNLGWPSEFGFWLSLFCCLAFFGHLFNKRKASLKNALYKVGLYSSGELRRSKPVWGPCEPSCVYRGSCEGWFVGLRVGLKV